MEEPGVFGILHPVLLWPEGISQHLDDAHLESIFAHELCHVQRRDNLTSAIHMLVAAIFWFHPLVWWLEKCLIDERERACDEAVLQLVKQPQIYAESILKVCEFCIESPLTCVSGITGADLKKRIVQIMTEPDHPANSTSAKITTAHAGWIDGRGAAGPVCVLASNAHDRNNANSHRQSIRIIAASNALPELPDMAEGRRSGKMVVRKVASVRETQGPYRPVPIHTLPPNFPLSKPDASHVCL